MDVTRRATFYAGNRGPKTFHIETDGCIVNITVGLRTRDGREVTRVDVLPDDETRAVCHEHIDQNLRGQDYRERGGGPQC